MLSVENGLDPRAAIQVGGQYRIKGRKGLHRATVSSEIYLFYICVCVCVCVCEYTVAVFRHQKRASDPIIDGCKPLCGCWGLNSGPLEEQSVTTLNC